MELDITEFFNNECPGDYSASIAELGRDAGKITWSNARECAQETPLFSECKRDEVIAFFDEFGVWEDIANWSMAELNALLIQLISGDIREGEVNGVWNWQEYEKATEAGDLSGNLFRGTDNRIYYYVGH